MIYWIIGYFIFGIICAIADIRDVELWGIELDTREKRNIFILMTLFWPLIITIRAFYRV